MLIFLIRYNNNNTNKRDNTEAVTSTRCYNTSKKLISTDIIYFLLGFH